jgi:hypothetical protein
VIIQSIKGFKVSMVQATAIPYKDTWVPNFIEKPYQDISSSISELNHHIDSFIYWINPVHWFTSGWHSLGDLIQNPETAIILMAGTIIGGWLMATGVKWPKKWLFWGWVIYWVLRGFVFV